MQKIANAIPAVESTQNTEVTEVSTGTVLFLGAPSYGNPPTRKGYPLNQSSLGIFIISQSAFAINFNVASYALWSSSLLLCIKCLKQWRIQDFFFYQIFLGVKIHEKLQLLIIDSRQQYGVTIMLYTEIFQYYRQS